jgi:hypothetical protein
MKYYTKEVFIEKSKVSCSTIDRFYRLYPEIGNDRKEVGKRKDIPESHLKYFDQNLMIKIDQEKDKKIINLQRINRMIRDKDSFAATLWFMDWTIFGTISYSSDYTKDTCYNKMVKMFNELKNVIEDSKLKIFFTTESYDVRYGNHNHFVINCNTENVNQVNAFLNNHFKWHRVDLEPYNTEEAGLFYICKDGLHHTDWDYLE